MTDAREMVLQNERNLKNMNREELLLVIEHLSALADSRILYEMRIRKVLDKVLEQKQEG